VKLTFTYTPVPDLAEALTFYRDTLGWEEAWREGTTTVAFQLPDTEVQFMIDQVTDGSRPGPVFLVDSVKDFHESHRDRVRFGAEPQEIPGGYWVAFDDPGGNPVYVMDQSTAGPG
jgi:catechol 2,3-dioxygenase-like lactoylglutathione lyase family enzyme